MGYARIEQNAHFTSDVVAGSVLGWSVARAVMRRHRQPDDPKRLTVIPYATGSGYGLLFHKAF